MSQQPTVPTTPQQNDLAATPLNDIERELVRTLLRGLRILSSEGIPVGYDWCKVRRLRRNDDGVDFVIELVPARMNTKRV